MNRFIVTTVEEARKIEGLVDTTWTLESDYTGGWTSVLIDTKNNTLIYADNEDSPEDKYLYRELGVFVDWMNELAAEAESGGDD